MSKPKSPPKPKAKQRAGGSIGAEAPMEPPALAAHHPAEHTPGAVVEKDTQGAGTHNEWGPRAHALPVDEDGDIDQDLLDRMDEPERALFIAPAHPLELETVADSTDRQYRRLTDRMFRLAGVARGLDEDQVVPIDVAEWLLDQKPSYTVATWRLYKIAFCYVIKGRPDAREALDLLGAETAKGALKVPARGGKRKMVSEDDLEKLTDFLIHRKGRKQKRRVSTGNATNALALSWLKAGIKTGLRPTEWLGTELIEDDGRRVLEVTNLKATRGRGTGEVRKIDVTSLPNGEIENIRLLMMVLKGYQNQGKFEQILQNCQIVLWRANNAIWPWRKQNITLYSGRHQFSANAKTVMTQEEVAALLGHRVIRTAKQHYGRASAGHSGTKRGVMPIPDPAVVSAISSRMTEKAANQTNTASDNNLSQDAT